MRGVSIGQTAIGEHRHVAAYCSALANTGRVRVALATLLIAALLFTDDARAAGCTLQTDFLRTEGSALAYQTNDFNASRLFAIDACYESVAIARGTPVAPILDGRAAAVYDADLSPPFRMWFFGDYAGELGPSGQTQPRPANLFTTDTIFYSESVDGASWSAPVTAVVPNAGLSGAFRGDDHLVGHPRVLYIPGLEIAGAPAPWVMFYEAYGNWIAPINRFYSESGVDNWVGPYGNAPAPGYVYERTLGFAPLYVRAGTRPIYAGRVTYPSGVTNAFLTRVQANCRSGPDAQGDWECLNNGLPAFWLFESAAGIPGRKPIYLCFEVNSENTFVSELENCDESPDINAVPVVEVSGETNILGYVAETLDGTDMVGSLQNRIMMATSADGQNWQRYDGPARGGAVVAPLNELTSSQGFDLNAAVPGGIPNPCIVPGFEGPYDVHRHYGSGIPEALVRDGVLELYFSDTLGNYDLSNCDRTIIYRRLTLPLSELGNNAAWAAAAAARVGSINGQPVQVGDHLAWSEMHQRYFATSRVTSGNPALTSFRQQSILLWSPDDRPFFPSDGAPLSGMRVAAGAGFPTGPGNGFDQNIHFLGGGFARTGLGHVVETWGPGNAAAFSVFHLYPEFDQPPSLAPVETDLQHVLVFAYPEDVDSDATPDWLDNCPDQQNPLQADFDGDGIGDACDRDSDNDGVPEALGGVVFYKGTGISPQGDLGWRRSATNIAEQDFEGFSNGQLVSTFSSADATVSVSLPNQGGLPSVFASTAFDVPGVMFNNALLNAIDGQVADSEVRFTFSPPVRAAGLWVFDDGGAVKNRFEIEVNGVRSPVLDAGGPSGVDGFIGAVDPDGFDQLTIRGLGSNPPEFFEMDHFQFSTSLSFASPDAFPFDPDEWIDSDNDQVGDNSDNCTLVPNNDQRDTNGDGFGNACDADLNNDGVVNVVDLGLLRSVFFSGDADADLNGDGVVNVVDLGIMRTGFFRPPGPSGLAP